MLHCCADVHTREFITLTPPLSILIIPTAHAVHDTSSPRMRSARFDATGSRVSVKFDQPVVFPTGARLTNVQCSKVFINAAQLLGSGAMCELRTTTTLQIVLSSDATLLPSPPSTQMLSLLEGALRSLRDEFVGAVGNVGVAAPTTPKHPVVVTEYQRSIGVCSDLEIDAAMSVAASGGRPLVFHWTVAFFNGTNKIHSPLNASALASVSVTAKEIPHETTTITVTLTLTSIFGTQSRDVIKVERALNQVPLVELSARSLVLRKNAFVVSASGSIPPCENGAGSSAVTPAFTYSWRLMQTGADNDDSLSIQQTRVDVSLKNLSSSTNKQGSGLRFASYALDSCATYRFRCTVGYSSRGKASVSNWQTHDLTVPQGKVVALISGE